jgi:HEAT repeat protein
MTGRLLATVLSLGAVVLLATGAAKEKRVKDLVDDLATCEALASCEPVQVLKARGKKIWPPIQVGLEHPDEMVRFWTLGVLSEVVIPRAQRAIASKLDDVAPRIRAAAAFALGAQKDKKVTPWLVKALGDKDVNVRYSAATALGRVKDPAAVGPLTRALRDKDEEVRMNASQALGDIGDRNATPALVERLEQDMVPQVRGYVAMALGQLQDPAARKPLIANLKREDDGKALAATVFALAAYRDPSLLPHIEPLADHPHKDVKSMARQAIAGLKKLQKKPTD